MPLTKKEKMRKEASSKISDMPLKNLEDYKRYNQKAREMGLPVKPAPAKLHEHVRVKFLRRDGMTHPVKLKFRNEFIDFEKTVKHAQEYELPKMVIKKYQDLGIPRYERIQKNKDESETMKVASEPRFAFQIVLDD